MTLTTMNHTDIDTTNNTTSYNNECFAAGPRPASTGS